MVEKKTDPFLDLLKGKDDEKKRQARLALEYAKRVVHTESGRSFYLSCKTQFDKKGSLTQKQVDALWTIDEYKSDNRQYGYHEDDHNPLYDGWDFDPFDP